MKKRMIGVLLALLLPAPLLCAGSADKDAKRLDKELKKIDLTAAVKDGRRVVNRMMAEQFGVDRKKLVEDRKETGLAYGQLFAVYELARLASVSVGQAAQEFGKEQDVAEVSEQHHVELKTILADAKKLNRKIEEELDRIADGDDDEDAVDAADSYDPSDDSVNSDTSGLTLSQIAQANNQVHNRGRQVRQGTPAGSLQNGSRGSSGMSGAPGLGQNTPAKGRGRP